MRFVSEEQGRRPQCGTNCPVCGRLVSDPLLETVDGQRWCLMHRPTTASLEATVAALPTAVLAGVAGHLEDHLATGVTDPADVQRLSIYLTNIRFVIHRRRIAATN